MTNKHIDFEVPGFGELAQPPREAPGYADALLSLSPTAYWKLDGAKGTQLADQVGTHPLTLSGEYTRDRPPAAPSADDGAVRVFNGKAQSAGSVLPLTANAGFSIVFWLRRMVPLTVGRVMSQHGPSLPGGLSITLRADGRIRLFVIGDPVLQSTAADVDTWTHVVLTRDSLDRAHWYVNGVADTSGTGHNRGIADVPFIIGFNVDSVLDVELDEVAVFPSVLTPQEIDWLYRIATDQPVPAIGG